MAGEQGFEPWLTESESVVLPLDDSPNEKAEATDFGFLQAISKLTLRELRTLASFVQADLLALYHAGITCQETSCAQ